VQPPTLSIGYGIYDFVSAQNIKHESFVEAFKKGSIGNLRTMSSALSLSYMEGVSKNFDISVGMTGSFLSYPMKNKQSFPKNNLLLEVEISLRAKPWSNPKTLVPYLQGGMGASRYLEYFGIQLPLGFGLQLNATNDIFVNISSQYRVAITNTASNHFLASITVGGAIGKKRNKIEKVTSPVLVKHTSPVDSDADGIYDSEDHCPLIPGLLVFQGCPDTDRDQIQDALDKCPFIPGVLRYEGCPIPDSDDDGLNDDMDSCVAIPGLALYRGCPVLDKDADGVADDIDHCLDVAGSVLNHGCESLPDTLVQAVTMLAKNILFHTGSHRLTTQSLVEIEKIFLLIRENESLTLDISAHTDSDGDSVSNLKLSKARLSSVINEFTKHGISGEKINGTVHGEHKPLFANDSPTSKRKNRRVEISLHY
jgi:OOP family OmpA-OmpF porin